MSERHQQNFDKVHPRKKFLIVEEIQQERDRQDKRWGEQNWPSTTPILKGRSVERLCEDYEIPTENRAKFLCENAFSKKEGSWAHILIEEVCEAICALTPEKRREELIQTAAVIVAWIESIDRNEISNN